MGGLDIAACLTECASVGSPRLCFRVLMDGGVSFPSRGSGGVYEAPFSTDRFQLGKTRNDSFIRGDGNLEARYKDNNENVGPKLGKM